MIVQLRKELLEYFGGDTAVESIVHLFSFPLGEGGWVGGGGGDESREDRGGVGRIRQSRKPPFHPTGADNTACSAAVTPAILGPYPRS